MRRGARMDLSVLDNFVSPAEDAEDAERVEAYIRDELDNVQAVVQDTRSNAQTNANRAPRGMVPVSAGGTTSNATTSITNNTQESVALANFARHRFASRHVQPRSSNPNRASSRALFTSVNSRLFPGASEGARFSR
jgi:hypothetical protein